MLGRITPSLLHTAFDIHRTKHIRPRGGGVDTLQKQLVRALHDRPAHQARALDIAATASSGRSSMNTPCRLESPQRRRVDKGRGLDLAESRQNAPGHQARVQTRTPPRIRQ